MTLPSGEQHELVHGDLRATVTEVGATLRELSAAGQPLVWGFGLHEMCSGGRGQVLAPWPNRLDEGRYRFAGHDGHAALDEPERNCAIHGLVRWRPWHLDERSESTARLSVVLHPSPAYPFVLELELTYRLGDDGLSVETVATNAGDEPLPFGIGFHSSLDPGPAGVDAARLSIPATQRIPLDHRYMPAGGPSRVGPGDRVATVLGAGPASSTSSGEGGAIADAVFDETLTGLLAGEDGRWRARFVPGEAGSGVGRLRPIEVWADARYRYCQLFTADTLPGANRRRAVAVEPMTCPPNAFRSGIDVVALEPGERFSASFGITPAG